MLDRHLVVELSPEQRQLADTVVDREAESTCCPACGTGFDPRENSRCPDCGLNFG